MEFIARGLQISGTTCIAGTAREIIPVDPLIQPADR